MIRVWAINSLSENSQASLGIGFEAVSRAKAKVTALRRPGTTPINNSDSDSIVHLPCQVNVYAQSPELPARGKKPEKVRTILNSIN
jgi:hypothetical protein